MALSVGIDIGSTTIKAVVLRDGEPVYSLYRRHEYHVPETLEKIAGELADELGTASFSLCLTGTGAEKMAKDGALSFLPEMDAEVKALRFFHEKVDVAVEMGGEDAKLIYLQADGKSDQRMNRMCAGGTGAFLEHLSAFLGTDMPGLNALAEKGRPVYGIASRCGVYAKTDVQALLNQGASKEDIAASVFQAVVNQILAGLAKGRRIMGGVAFLGGPLTFLPVLKAHFIETLGLSAEDVAEVRHGELYPALGAALAAAETPSHGESLKNRLCRRRESDEKALWMEPLFSERESYEDFRKTHRQEAWKEGHRFPKVVWLGVDAGSTTMKLAAVDEEGALVYQDYGRNEADVLEKARDMLGRFYEVMPEGTVIAGCGITGYGEDFLKKAFSMDFGEVETVAHLEAARFFAPDVTSLLDIGGQDMKYIRLEKGAIREVALNGACASGCGLFLETFAHTLGLSMDEFVHAALAASHRLDLGYHCTVLMNSRVRQVQREKLDIGALAAGLCTSVVKNALYRVIRMKDAEELGERVVVSGGLFMNDAVLRALEMLLGRPVFRPPYPGLMGACGMALLARARYGKSHHSSLLSASEIKNLRLEKEERHCPGCGNRCLLSLRHFSNGNVYVTGNRCSVGERLAGGSLSYAPNLAEWEKERIFRPISIGRKKRGVVGIPRVLSLWKDFPFWNAFWTSLGYEVRTSRFDSEMMSHAAPTVPQGVYCYPCRLAHGHVLEMLQRGSADFLWLPERRQGIEEPELDEERHASYGGVLAGHMKKEIEEAGIPLYHPLWEESEPEVFFDFMKRHLPKLSREEIEKAILSGKAAQKNYHAELRDRTEKLLDYIHREKKRAIVLLDREEQLDGEVNKGIPYLIARLGVPVLTAEGLQALWHEEGETISFAQRILETASMVAEDPYLELVRLQSTSCGYDGVTMLEAEDLLRRAGKKLTPLSLDQGVSAGALQIRIRSLLAEARERGNNPSRREEESALFQRQPLPRAFQLSSLGIYYDGLLLKAFRGMGYEAERENASPVLPLVTLKRKESGALFLGLGRKGDDLPPKTLLFHRLWIALFLGDVLLRCHLAAKAVEIEKGAADRALEMAESFAARAAEAGSFLAYRKAIGDVLALFERVKKKGTPQAATGLLGTPWQCMDFLKDHREEAASWKTQGMAEWLLNELSEEYSIEGFKGDADGAAVSFASRTGAYRALEMLREQVNSVSWLDSFESPEEKRDALARYRDFPGRYPPEGKRDLLRRGAEKIIFVE